MNIKQRQLAYRTFYLLAILSFVQVLYNISHLPRPFQRASLFAFFAVALFALGAYIKHGNEITSETSDIRNIYHFTIKVLKSKIVRYGTIFIVLATLASAAYEIYNNSITPEDYFIKALKYSNSENYEKALLALKKATELEPDFGAAYFKQGEVYLWMDDLDSSLSAFHKATNLSPALNKKKSVYLGMIHYKNKDYLLSKIILEQFLEQNPDNELAHYVLALTYVETNDFKKAKEEYNILKERLSSYAVELEPLFQ